MRATVAAVLLVASVSSGLPGAAALTPEEREEAIAAELEVIRSEFAEVSAAEAELAAALEVSRRLTAELDAALVRLDEQLRAGARQLRVAEDELAAASAHREEVLADLARTRAALGEAKDGLRDQAVTAFMQGRIRPSAMKLVLHAEDVTEALSIATLADAVVELQDEVIEETQRLEELTERLEVDAVRAEAAAEAQRLRVADEQASLESLRRERADARADAAAEAEVEASLLADAQARKQSYQERAGALEAESAAIAELLRKRAEEEAARRAAEEARQAEEQARREAAAREQAEAAARAQADAEARARAEADARAQRPAAPSAPPAPPAPPRSPSPPPVAPSGSGVLGYPVASPVTTSSFGYRTHPIFGGRRLHAGMDLRAPTGTPILAAAAGVVVSAGYSGGYGNMVLIDHGGSLATLYAHQSRLAVSSGDRVSRGEVIGSAGSTGSSTGPHLHFEVRVDGTPVDPAAYL